MAFTNHSLRFLTLALSITLAACVKTEFDEPPIGGVPVDIQTNTTIKQLKALHVTPGALDKINQDLIIGGEVIMDDRSGNYYKTLVIQDETGGIEVKFNDGYLYNAMPVGRTIYVRCKDLILTDYNGLPQLTGSIVVENGVPDAVGLTAAQVRTKVVKGAYTNKITPKLVKISDLNPDMINTLLEFADLQFTQCDAGKTFADATTKNSLNRVLQDCNNQELILRSSGYSNFAAQTTPVGGGNIRGVLGVYGSDYQLFVRDTHDLDMNDGRCGSESPNNATPATIADIRAAFTGTITTAPAGKKIKGTVISDRANKNLNNRNLYLQDASGGIVVRFEAEHCFELGDEIEVVVSGEELSEFNKLLQVNNVPLNNATLLSTGKSVSPRNTTIAEINANYNVWESTLVKIANVTLSGGPNYSGTRTLTDATGNIVMFTSSAATFATLTLPTTPVTLTAIVSDYNGKQVLIRNINDIQ
jgi:DNA/RNA endonuclease YhcR with UshA esterase domain